MVVLKRTKASIKIWFQFMHIAMGVRAGIMILTFSQPNQSCRSYHIACMHNEAKQSGCVCLSVNLSVSLVVQ